jgi:hypothetical protein
MEVERSSVKTTDTFLSAKNGIEYTSVLLFECSPNKPLRTHEGNSRSAHSFAGTQIKMRASFASLYTSTST